jgi:hypothetical protein
LTSPQRQSTSRAGIFSDPFSEKQPELHIGREAAQPKSIPRMFGSRHHVSLTLLKGPLRNDHRCERLA